MIKKLIKSVFLAIILSVFLVIAASVSINPQNPRTNDDLSCYVNDVLCTGGAGCNAYWYVNNQHVLIAPTLPSGYTGAGDSIECRTYISGHLQGSAFITILNSNPVIQNIPDVLFNEDTTYSINLNNYVSDLDNDPITWTYSGNTNINIVINNGVATLTPNLNFNGQETITFIASDNRGGSASDSVLATVNPMNDPVSLNDISDIYMNENSIYTLDLTNEIIDPDGDLQDIQVFGNLNINVNVDFANRIVTFSPKANWFGPELITISVMDATSSDTDSFLVIVNEINDPPVINSFSPNQLSVNVNEGSSQVFSVIASDPEGSLLTYEWRLNNVVVGTGTNYIYNALDGPAINDLVVRVSDGNSITTNTWNVNEINLNPTADANGPYSCMINTNIILRGSASDPGQETFLFEWDTNNDGIYELSTWSQNLQIGCPATSGPLTLRVSDGDNGFDTDSTFLTVDTNPINNQPYFDPVLVNQIAVVNQLFNYDIDAYDADGDVLTYSDNRAEFDINSNTGLISFMPLGVGIIPATITVCDNSGFLNACYSESFNIDVRATANNNPTVQISSPSNGASFVLGNSITFSGIGNDPEDGSLTGSQLQWTSSINGNIGQGQTFSTNSLSLGTHIITLTGTDSGGASDTDSISITVSAAPSQCSDSIDNDSDGLIDLNDPGCSSSADNDETDPVVLPQCADGIDNDGDGAIDYPSDLGCVSAGDTSEMEAPVAAAGNDISTNVNTAVNFNGSASYDVDGTITIYSWNFGDSTSGNGANVQHSYSSAGTYNVVLTVTDNNGLIDSDDLVVIVTSAGGVSATTRFRDIEHEFEISEAKIISDVKAGEDVKILVELENTGSFDEKINLRLKNNNLLLLKDFGEYEVEEGKTKLIYLTFKLANDASGNYELQLDAYNNNYETSRFIEIDTDEKTSFTSLLTGGVAGYDVIVEEESGVWIWTILILIVIILIGFGIKKIFK